MNIRSRYIGPIILAVFIIGIGGTMGKLGVKIHDYCAEKEIEFPKVKNALQKLLDANNE